MKDPLLDVAELERRVPDAKGWLLPIAGAAVTEGILFAAGLLQLAAFPATIVVMASAVFAIALVRQVEEWWARNYAVPLEMYRERLSALVTVTDARLNSIRLHASAGGKLMYEPLLTQAAVAEWNGRVKEWMAGYTAIQENAPLDEQDILVMLQWKIEPFLDTVNAQHLKLRNELKAKVGALESVRELIKQKLDAARLQRSQ